MRRNLLGIIALALLVAAVYGLVVHGVTDDEASMITSICLRVGLVLGAAWLALPQLTRLSGKASPWIIVPVAAAAVAITVRPRTIVVFGPILLLLGLLHLLGRFLRTPPR